MRKIVINIYSFHRFDLTLKAMTYLYKLNPMLFSSEVRRDPNNLVNNSNPFNLDEDSVEFRSNRDVVNTVEYFNKDFPNLRVVEVPDDVEVVLIRDDYDQTEYVAEKHRTWGKEWDWKD